MKASEAMSDLDKGSFKFPMWGNCVEDRAAGFKTVAREIEVWKFFRHVKGVRWRGVGVFARGKGSLESLFFLKVRRFFE